MAITTTTAGWDRSTSQPAAMPILNYNLAPSLAPYPDPSLSSSSSSGLSARQQWHTPTDSSNRSRDTTTLRRERELLEAAGPVTYTPATHRISKAKKGKRVHLCQFAGCNKVFTRAEHRRRHELNHNAKASFVCSVCSKGFHRHDLLARHLEKHSDPSQTQTPKPSPARRRTSSRTSTVSSAPLPPPPAAAAPSEHQLTPIPCSLPITTTPAPMTSTSSLSHPYSDDFAASFWGQASKPLDKSHTLTPYTTTMHLDDLAPFSSPGSSRCSSSSSTSSPFQISSQFPVIEQFPEAAFAPQLSASPSLLPAACSYPNEWASLEAVVPQPPPPMLLPTTTTTTTNSSALSTPFEGGDLPQTVGEPSLIYRWPSSRHAGHQQLTDGPGGPAASAPSSSSAPIVPVSVPGSIAVPVPPVPLSRLDGVEWFALRRELTSAPGVVSDHDGLAVIDLAKWQDCLEYYWRFFHPLFPVVHRASFFLVKPSPLMAGAMVAIGSLFDGRRNSREYSTALLEACGKILAKRNLINSRSRISDIQAVFLLEILSKFRSRRADVKVSHRLRTLYGSFIQDSHWVSQNPLAVYHSLPTNPSIEDIRKAQKFWIEHETRRRVLQAAFILEVQQSVFFQQPLAPFLQSSNLDPDPAMREYRISHKVDFPFPCSSKLWECADLEQWMEFARQYEPLVSSSARERIVIQDSSGASGGSGSGEVKNRTIEIDPFQASLVFSQTLPNTVDMEDKMEVFVDKVAGKAATAVDDDGCKSDTTSYIRFLYHALLAAKHVPLQALVTVHGESWLFNRKVSEAEFRAAKERLRVWTGETEEMHRALWHAVHVLRYAVDQDSRSQTQTSAKDPLPLLPHANASESAAAGPLTMLQANWILYICTLICWTYENRTSLNNSPLSTDTVTATDSLPSAPISLRGYISVILSSSSSSSSSCASFPSLREFLDYHRQDNNNDKTSPYNLTTILAHMRQTIINNAGGSLSGCGLLNEAGRVLMRLEEAGRQQHNQYLQQQHHQQQQQLSYQHRHLHQRRRQFQHHHHSQHPQTYNTSQIQHLHEHYIPPQHIPTTTTTSITATTTTSTLQHQPAWEFIDSEF